MLPYEEGRCSSLPRLTGTGRGMAQSKNEYKNLLYRLLQAQLPFVHTSRSVLL